MKTTLIMQMLARHIFPPKNAKTGMMRMITKKLQKLSSTTTIPIEMRLLMLHSRHILPHTRVLLLTKQLLFWIARSFPPETLICLHCNSLLIKTNLFCLQSDLLHIFCHDSRHYCLALHVKLSTSKMHVMCWHV